MDFFEKLQGLIINRFAPEPTASYGDGYFVGVTATIEALKEMVVGEPIPMTVVHGGERYRNTFIVREGVGSVGVIRLGKGHHGTDGEEVVVMVFRDMKEQGK